MMVMARAADVEAEVGPGVARAGDGADGAEAEVRRCVARASEHAVVLGSVARAATDTLGETFADLPGEELAAQAHRLRGLVLHGLALLADLQLEAGRLEGLAVMGRDDRRGR